jgi:hypothetical protein
VQVIVSHTFCPSIGEDSGWAIAELCAALKSAGHKIEDMLLPFDPGHSPLEQLLAFRLFEPIEYGDIMLALHPPCHTTCHRGKVIWVIEGAMRTEILMPPGYFAADAASRKVHESIRVSDRLGYAEARRICLRSRQAAEAFASAEGTPACVLPLPPRVLHSGAPEGHIVAALASGAAPALLLTAIEALSLASPSIRLLLAGDNPFSADQWARLLSFHGVSGRVEWRPASEWPSLLPSAMAILGLSYSSDETGRSAIDAHGCERPIVAFETPSSIEWVEDGVNGLRLPVDPVSTAAALTGLASDLGRAHELGLQGKARLDLWGANWNHAVKTLTEL